MGPVHGQCALTDTGRSGQNRDRYTRFLCCQRVQPPQLSLAIHEPFWW